MLVFVFSLGICSYPCYNYFLASFVCLTGRQTERQTVCPPLNSRKSLFSLFPANRILCKGQGIKDRNCITKLSLEATSSFPWNLQRPSGQLLTWQGEFLTLSYHQFSFLHRSNPSLAIVPTALISSSEDFRDIVPMTTAKTQRAMVSLQHVGLDQQSSECDMQDRQVLKGRGSRKHLEFRMLDFQVGPGVFLGEIEGIQFPESRTGVHAG